MMGDGKTRPFRYTRGKLSFELTIIVMAILWGWRAWTWGWRRLKPIAYHPVALGGITIYTGAWIMSPWAACALLWAAVAWPLIHPDSYLRHAHPRTQSFLAGFYYRHRPRRKLTTCALLNDQDPTPTISHIQKLGCITRMRIKMSHGDEINMWRVRAAQIAQTYNALDCKINPYRRKELNPLSHKMVTKPRWLTLDFLTRDPFSTNLGVEYIDYHEEEDTFTPVVAVKQTGEPKRDNLAAHKLAVAMTQWGKSTRIRAKVRAFRHKIRKGELELWGIDGKGGVEQSFMKHVFARVAYGDSKLSPHSYNPSEFDRLLKDAVKVLQRRQKKMRGNTTHHQATKEEPWLLIIIDELLVLTSKAVPADIRGSIAQSIMLIQQQGIACGVSLDASTQLAQKERIDFRDGFTEFEVGKVERGAVDMIFGTGWWERGARADEFAEDLKGSFYVKTDSTMVPEVIRYPNTSIHDVSSRALGFTVDGSVLWPPKRQHLQAVPKQPEPEAEPELETVVESLPTPQPTPERDFDTLPPGIGGFA